MYWIVDVLVILFVGLMIYNGIRKGFMNTTFTLVTAILWIGLAGGGAFALMYFVFKPLGFMQDIQNAFMGFANSLSVVLKPMGVEPAKFAEILGYVLIGIVLFIPLYIFFLWVGRQFERFVRFVRSKNMFFKIFGSTLGGIVNLAIAAAVVLGFFWLIGAVDGSGVFTYTNEVVRAAPLSGLIYEHNPLYSFLGAHGSLSETVANIVTGGFLTR